MKISISDNKKIQFIQKEFNEMFPFLKIEFFTKPHRTGGTSPRKQMKNPDSTLKQCRSVHGSGNITITPAMTVAELEQNFYSLFGLSTQIFRKSGKVWLETTVTDSWTLKEQNEEGQALSS